MKIGGILRKVFRSKWLVVFLSFLLPMIVFAITLVIFNLFNGSATVLFTDAGAQYIDFLAYQKHLLSGEATAGFFLNGMLGSEGMPLMAYYLLSPLNLIMVLFPIEALPYVFYAFVIIKIGLAGLTAYLFLNSYRDKSRNSILNSRWLILVFSTSYALCGFVALYFWNIMWLDAVMLLPLVALGIRKMVREGRVLLYVITLALAIITNYYTGYMLGIFSIIWFIYEMKVERFREVDIKRTSSKAETKRGGEGIEAPKRIILKYVGATLVAVLLSAIVLVPTAKYMLGGTGSQHLFLSNFIPVPRFFLPELLGQLTTGAFNGVEHYMNGLPNFFIGTILTVFVILYFLNKKIGQREKIWSAIVVDVLVLSMWIRTLNSIWHGGAIEFWFPTRFAFILAFVLTFLAYRGLQKFEKIGKKEALITGVIYLVILVSSACINHDKWLLLLMDGLLVILTIVLMKKRSLKKSSYVILALLQIVNLGINLGCAISYLHKDEPFEPGEISDFYEENDKVIRRLKEYDNGMYRVEKTYRRSFNDAMALNYRGISQFSSTANASAVKLLEDLGYSKPDNIKIVYDFDDDKILPDSFLGIKYILSKDELGEPYRLIFTESGVNVYENPFALSLATIVPEEWLREKNIKELLNSVETEIEEEGGAEVEKGGEEKMVETIKNVEINDGFSDEHLSMDVTVNDDNEMLLLTIAYAPGWKAYVDGEPVKIEKAFGTLMAIPLENGSHLVEFKFS